MRRLPIGLSSFERIRREGYVYVDKTPYIYNLIQLPFTFFARPRRFGKSLLVDTLEVLFEGKQELFEGLWIYDKIEWRSYPVIRLDFSLFEYRTERLFEASLIRSIQWIGQKYEVEVIGLGVLDQLHDLVNALQQKYEQGVVILIDEYDRPINAHLTDVAVAKRYQTFMQHFYALLKGLGSSIHFLFITGISKFAKTSVFSAMNNLMDISMRDAFNSLIGFTQQEVETYFGEYIDAFVTLEQTSRPDLLEKVRHFYNGYSWNGKERVYNPYSLMFAFDDLAFSNHWFETATPSFLIKLIKERYSWELEHPPSLLELEEYVVGSFAFDSYDLEQIDLITLLFQTGYLTIRLKEGRGVYALYTLSYPNHEVRMSLNTYILGAFTSKNHGQDIIPLAMKLRKCLVQENIPQFLTVIRSLFAGIPYLLLAKSNEAYFQSLFYMMLTLLGENMVLERLTDKGRIDGVLELDDKIYIIEFKYSMKGSMDYLLTQAMKQMQLRKYHEVYADKEKRIILLGIGFLRKETIKEKIELTIEGLWQEA